jgi:glucose/arabinose dehydrogenase
MLLVEILGHLLLAAGLVVAPSLLLAPPTFWKLPSPQLMAVAAVAVGYLIAVLVQYRIVKIEGRIRLSRVLLVGAAVLGTCLAVVAVAEWLLPTKFGDSLPRETVLAGLGAAMLGLIAMHLLRSVPLLQVMLAGAFLLVGLAGQAAFHKRWLPRPEPAHQTTHYVDTSLYQLKLTTYINHIPKHWRMGGGLASWGPDYLLGTGNGALYVLRFDEAGSLSVKPLQNRTVPVNAEEFQAGAREIFKSAAKNYVESARFRVADILIQEHGDKVRLLASHHYWKTREQCFVLRVSMMEGSRSEIEDARASLKWRTLYETSPCLKLNTTFAHGPRFEGMSNGGRMALLDDDTLLVSVGDHGFDGVSYPTALPQDPTSAYGKIMRVRISTGEASMFSLGHRNPQGLYVDPNGAVWSTEHGPRGGDELNLVREGGNYGWPLVTYGTDYSRRTWPLNTSAGRHEGFDKPLFAFMPSVGISSLVGVSGPLFPLWTGDLILSSLKGQSIWRTRIEDGRVIFAEHIPVARQVRDIAVGGDGRLMLWTNEHDLVLIEPTAANTGEALVSQCLGCHGLNVWDGSSALGPNLSMIVGRPVASRDDFEYSDAMRKFGGRWTRERLDSFLANPQTAVPGTKMPFTGIPDPEQRKALIDYLEHLPGDK